MENRSRINEQNDSEVTMSLRNMIKNVLYSSDCAFLNTNHHGFCDILSDVGNALNYPGFVLKEQKTCIYFSCVKLKRDVTPDHGPYRKDEPRLRKTEAEQKSSLRDTINVITTQP